MVISDLRQVFVERGPEAMRELSHCFDDPLAGLLIAFSELPFTYLGSARPKNSIQEFIIDTLEKSGAKDIEDQYTAALKSARGVFFDCVTSDLLRFLPKEDDLSKALWRALIIQDPAFLSKTKGAFEYVVDGMRRGGFEFLNPLVDDRRNFSEKRTRKIRRETEADESNKNTTILNELKWIMAANWTNPHMPLWLMQSKVIESALKLLLSGDGWGERVIEQTITRNKLTRRGSQNPIKALVREPAQSKYLTAELKGKEFSDLDGKVLPISFVRPLIKFDDSKVASEAIKFEQDRRALIRIRKSDGESSMIYKDALAAMASHFDLTLVAPLRYRIKVQR